MKPNQYHANFLLLFFFILALPFISNGQARDKKQTVDLLCHQWESDFTKSPQKMDCFPPESGSSIRFLTNGYVIFSEKKGAEGVWNYDAARNNLYLIINGTLWKYNIRSLTATELAVESAASTTNTVFYLLRGNP